MICLRNLAFYVLILQTALQAQPHLSIMQETALHRGVYEVRLPQLRQPIGSIYDVVPQVTFVSPTQVRTTVDCFYDGEGQFKARAYCNEVGDWTWHAKAGLATLDGVSGEFTVRPSALKGKLRISSRDPYQFQFDNGDWFLHIGDTGYRFVVNTEPHWQPYIDQAAEAGFTKIRTWFCQARSTVEALFTADRSAPALDYWQEIDRRVSYALEHHPHVILQLIPYAEDTAEIKRYAAGDMAARFVMAYAQARWSAFPNVHWCLSNDREIVTEGDLTGRKVHWDMIDQMGRDAQAREPWGTLTTNHQARFTGYAHAKANWSDIVTLEDLDQVHGEVILDYRAKAKAPAVLDEDRYELYRNPAHHRYFFRRYAWGILLSGGHPTYGGLKTYEAWDGGPERGVQGYFHANRQGVLFQGAHDFRHIHAFFETTGLSLIGMRPDDAIVGNAPLRWKCCHDETTYLVYLANPTGDKPETDNPSPAKPFVAIELPPGTYELKWFEPYTGKWLESENISRGRQKLSPPNTRRRVLWGDWVLLLEKRSQH